MYFDRSNGFPKDFLWGSASAAYQIEERGMRMAKAHPTGISS